MNESRDDSLADKDDFFLYRGGGREKREEAREARLLCAAQTHIARTKTKTRREASKQCTSTHFSTISLTLVWMVAIGTSGRGETSSSAGTGYTAVRMHQVRVVDSDRARGWSR
jgi:hypothetical protein